jgi:two-component system cell cycle sensor histidine kinase/response regulator CckA
MVVEDEEALRDIIAEVLNILNIEAVICENGNAAIEKAEQHEKDIDLFLIDLFMPEMSGEETYKQLSRSFPDRPVIFMSGFDESSINISENNQKFLKKPFSISDLKDTILSFNK